MSSNNERLRRNPPRGSSSSSAASSSDVAAATAGTSASLASSSSRPTRQTRQTTNGRKAPIIIDDDDDDDLEEIKPAPVKTSSTMSRPTKPAATCDVNFDDVAKLESITGLSRTESIELLKACNNNLETAINIHLNNQPVVESKKPTAAAKGALKRTHEDIYQNDESSSSASAALAAADDDVRAPIPQKSDRLVDYDPYALFRNQSKRPKSVFDGFRNIQEEYKDVETSPSKRKAKSNLAQIFRPPTDLMFSGSLEAAKTYGCKENKWILLNVQKTDSFECHCLNRDLWRDETVKEIVRASFVFLLIYEETSEGAKMMNYYNIHSFPFVAVLDPRTGEKVAHFKKKYDVHSFCEAVTTFLSDRELPVIHDDTFEEKTDEANTAVVVVDDDTEPKVVNGFKHHHEAGANVHSTSSRGLTAPPPALLTNGKVDLSKNGYFKSINNKTKDAHLTNGTSSSSSSSSSKGKSAASVLAELTGEPSYEQEVDVEKDESSNDSDQKIYRNTKSKARLQSSDEDEEVVVRKDKYDLMKKSSSQKLADEVKQISIDGGGGGGKKTATQEKEAKPAEPPKIIKYEAEGTGPKDCFLRILFPNGDRLDFATNGDSHLKVLVEYLGKLGFKKSTHELIERLMPHFQAKGAEVQQDSQVTHQSRNLLSLDPNTSTFKDAGLFPRTFLLLQEI